jgi:ketosteroid isomerase-like protein
MTPVDDLRETIEKTADALNHVASGDPEPYKALWSQRQDVTLFGGFGGYALGWDQVSQNTDWAASLFRGAKSYGVEMLVEGASGDLGYTISIERGEVRVEGRDDYAPLVVRVTHIYRREEGVWKIIHRHGDPVAERTEASAILHR